MHVQLRVTNCSGYTQTVPEGHFLGYAMAAEVLESEPDLELSAEGDSVDVELAPLRRVTTLTAEERKKLLLETVKYPDLPPAEMKLLQQFLAELHDAPWASPVVIVRKKDGTHRFCVNYRALNAVTKADTFPLPRISDLLDQLGGARYFLTLDLASGF